jgi:glutamine synthetase
VLEGNAYASGGPRVPASLAEAVGLFGGSEVALKAFGEDVVAHYVRAAEVEIEAFQKAVTDWERFRGFERL